MFAVAVDQLACMTLRCKDMRNNNEQHAEYQTQMQFYKSSLKWCY